MMINIDCLFVFCGLSVLFVLFGLSVIKILGERIYYYLIIEDIEFKGYLVKR